jgi:hypothetical protein
VWPEVGYNAGVSSVTTRVRTRVLPGHRIECAVPEVPVGAEVEIQIAEVALHRVGVADYLAGLAPVSRSPEEWAALEADFAREREAWDR